MSGFVCFDYSEADAFFRVSEARRGTLVVIQPRLVCRLRDVTYVAIEAGGGGGAVHYVSVKNKKVTLLRYDAADEVPAGEINTVMTRIFDERVRAVLMQAYKAADAPMATRLAEAVKRMDGVIERLDALPHCGAGRDFVAAEERFESAKRKRAR